MRKLILAFLVLGSPLYAATITNPPGLPAATVHDATLLTGLVPNASVDSSSVTKQGNSFNTGSQLLQLSGGLVPNAAVDSSSVTKQGNTFNTGTQLLQLSGGLVPNANVDSSSVTKQGNTFNGASQLVQLNGSSQLPAVSGALLTNLPAGAAPSGTIIQRATATITGSSATVSTTYVPTTLAVTITPTATTSSVTITGMCSLDNANPSASGVNATLERNAVNLAGANGYWTCNNGQAATTSISCPFGISLTDFPSSVSAQTYTVYIKTGSGSVAATLNANTVTCVLEAVEIKGG